MLMLKELNFMCSGFLLAAELRPWTLSVSKTALWLPRGPAVETGGQGSGFSHVTCFSEQDVSKGEVSRGLTWAGAFLLPPSFLCLLRENAPRPACWKTRLREQSCVGQLSKPRPA